MSAHTSDTNFGFALAGRATAERAPTRTEGQKATAGRMSFFRWLAEMPRRRAVMNELAALSDHDLADIGLARGDIPRVFDAGFKTSRLPG